jgi:hypothetical protein
MVAANTFVNIQTDVKTNSSDGKEITYKSVAKSPTSTSAKINIFKNKSKYTTNQTDLITNILSDKDKLSRDYIKNEEDVTSKYKELLEIVEQFHDDDEPKDYSLAYVKYNTQVLINELLVEFNVWRQVGTDNALFRISQIKDLLDQYRKYMYGVSEYRVFISTLDLLFTNNSWENLTSGQLNQLIQILKQIKYGDISVKILKNISIQLYKSNLHLLKSTNEKKRK